MEDEFLTRLINEDDDFEDDYCPDCGFPYDDCECDLDDDSNDDDDDF